MQAAVDTSIYSLSDKSANLASLLSIFGAIKICYILPFDTSIEQNYKNSHYQDSIDCRDIFRTTIMIVKFYYRPVLIVANSKS